MVAYQTNKTEIDWRALFYGYGINSAPSGRMDGQNVTVFGARPIIRQISPAQ